jgi:tetratricopeptide (TPR) repeat protein
MYLSGSKWNMRKKRRRANPWRILLLLALIGGAVYLQRFVVPSVPPLFVPTATPTRSPASYMLVAQSLFQAGKLSQAEDAYRQAIEADPQQATPYLELARVQVFAGQYQDAETTARDGLLINPDSAIGHAVHGWTLDFLGKDSLVDAQREVESALSLDPNLALAHAYYAEVLIDSSLDNYKKALDEAQRAVQMDPNMLEAHRALGYVWENTQNYDQALQEYSAALRINPNLAPLHIAVGNMYFNLGDTNKATESYLKASSLDPTNSEPLTRIAQAYARVGEYGKASQYAANAVEQRPSDPYLHGDLGRMFYKNNELDKAVSELTLAVRGGTTESGAQVKGIPMDPGDSRGIEFYWTYGLALAKTQQCGVAVQIFQALVQVVKDDDTTIANATQGLVLCGVIQPTATPRATAAP